MKRTKKLAGCLMLLKFSSFYIMEILSSHHNKETRRTDGVRAFSVSQCSTPLLHPIKTHFTPHFHHWSRPHPLRKLDWRAPKTTPQYPNGSSRSYRLASPPPKKHICGEGTSTPRGRRVRLVNRIHMAPAPYCTGAYIIWGPREQSRKPGKIGLRSPISQLSPHGLSHFAFIPPLRLHACTRVLHLQALLPYLQDSPRHNPPPPVGIPGLLPALPKP